MMAQITGGCLCGRVRYAVDGEPPVTGVCHCKDCQRETGSAFAVAIVVPEAALSIEGKTKTFSYAADSGRPVQRSFCPECGSSLFGKSAGFPGMTIIKGGSLDDTSRLRPTFEIYCDSAQPWVALQGEMQRFARSSAGQARG
jgi:hypothetical protein